MNRIIVLLVLFDFPDTSVGEELLNSFDCFTIGKNTQLTLTWIMFYASQLYTSIQGLYLRNVSLCVLSIKSSWIIITPSYIEIG